MAHNPVLANALGISQEDRNRIDDIHEALSYVLEEMIDTGYSHDVYKAIEKEEFTLQRLWGWKEDPDYHTWKHLYRFRCQWAGTEWTCNTTGETFVVPNDVRERDFYSFGEAFLDVGTLDGYYRLSNCTGETRCLD